MLRAQVAKYVALRRATGFQFNDQEMLLKSFAAFAGARGDCYVCGATAVRWAEEAKSQRRRHIRLRVVSRFSEYLRAEDSKHEMPPQRLYRNRWSRPTPRIFSENELESIMVCAGELGPGGSLRGLTYYTLFGLLATTGLRSSEATGLRLADVTEDGLVIRGTKFRKSRLVPLHETTRAALARYIDRRRGVAIDTDLLFVSQRRTKLSKQTVLRTFRLVAQSLHIGPNALGRLPRVHDLRHTFAVHAIERSPIGRDRVERHMVALATYLGHANIRCTYWYLEATPRLLKDIAAACDAVTGGGR